MPEAQPSPRWTPASGPLGELTLASEVRARTLAADPRRIAILEEQAGASPQPPAFATALRGPQVRVIAELKRRSPSKGVINDTLQAPERAAQYERGGAAALSILTEPSRFGGSLEDLAAVRSAVALPLLRKDFITHELQLLEARACGASAVLLIARALAPDRVRALAREAHRRGLECLVEIRSEAELEVALSVPGAVVGVNNRNLETLVIDDAVGHRLIPRIPSDRVAVYESGVASARDVERAARIGADAVLVGSVLSASPDGEAAVRALAAVERHARA